MPEAFVSTWPASRATPRFAHHRSSFACTTRRHSTGDCTSWRGARSHSPIRHANYWSSRILRQSCLAQSVLSFVLPPDESATPFSRQDKPLPELLPVLARCGEMCIYECCISCMLSNPRVSNNDTNQRGWQNTMAPNVKLRKANAERYLLRAANGSFPHATLILSSCTSGCRQLTCAAACA
jgi:hypothetical protein